MKQVECVEKLGGCGRWWRFPDSFEKPLTCPWCGSNEDIITLIDRNGMTKEMREELAKLERTAKETRHRNDQSLEIMKRICNESKDKRCKRSSFVLELTKSGLTLEKAEDEFDLLILLGYIYEPVRGKFAVTDI